MAAMIAYADAMKERKPASSGDIDWDQPGAALPWQR